MTQQDHQDELELSLKWLFGENELNENLVLDQQGFIYRDIERIELPKFFRRLRALLCCANLETLHKISGKCCAGFRINSECRPYHLGWILYAWADYDQGSR